MRFGTRGGEAALWGERRKKYGPGAGAADVTLDDPYLTSVITKTRENQP